MERNVFICLIDDPELDDCILLQTRGPLMGFGDHHCGSKGYLDYRWKLGAKSLRKEANLLIVNN